MKKIKISITQKNIDTGIRKDCTKCPIALAFKEKFKFFTTANVYSDGSFVIKNPYSYLNLCDYLPRSAKTFIKNFDEHGIFDVIPFFFYLKVSNKEYNKLIKLK